MRAINAERQGVNSTWAVLCSATLPQQLLPVWPSVQQRSQLRLRAPGQLVADMHRVSLPPDTHMGRHVRQERTFTRLESIRGSAFASSVLRWLYKHIAISYRSHSLDSARHSAAPSYNKITVVWRRQYWLCVHRSAERPGLGLD